MGAPLVVFLLSGLAIVLQAFLRGRLVVVAIISGIFGLLIAILILIFPLEQAIQIGGISFRIEQSWLLMGRSFSLGDQNRVLVAYLYIVGGLFLLGSWGTRTSRMYYPLAMGIVTMVSASLMIDPFLFAAILLELSAITALLILSTRERGESRGGIRLLIQYTMAMLAILIAGSQIDVTVPAGFLFGESVILLLGFGFAVLISVPPFHSWLPIAASETHPMALGFSGSILPAAGLFFILRFIGLISPVENSEGFFVFLRFGGIALSLLCIFWALVADGLSKAGSYLLVADMSLILVALGLGTADGFILALTLLAARIVGIFVWSLGVSILTQDVHPEPSSRVLAVLGLASLVGLPLTAGFPARWELITAIQSLEGGLWIVLAVAYGLMTFVILRLLRNSFLNRNTQNGVALGGPAGIVVAGGVLLAVGLGFFSTVFQEWARVAAIGLGLVRP